MTDLFTTSWAFGAIFASIIGYFYYIIVGVMVSRGWIAYNNIEDNFIEEVKLKPLKLDSTNTLITRHMMRTGKWFGQ